MDGGPSTSTIDMARHGHPSPEHALIRDPNSPGSPRDDEGSSPPPPLLKTTKMASSSGNFWTRGAGATTTTTTTTKPMTMFYNGGVAVFHLPKDKAEELMKMVAGEEAGEGTGRPGPRRPNDGEQLVAKFREDNMPIASKRSLQRFFQKRKERMYRP